MTVSDDVDPPPSASLADHGLITGPFLHGTRTTFSAGVLVLPGRPSHFRPDRPLAHVYVTTRPETAVWGAELAAALVDADDEAATPRRRAFVRHDPCSTRTSLGATRLAGRARTRTAWDSARRAQQEQPVVASVGDEHRAVRAGGEPLRL